MKKLIENLGSVSLYKGANNRILVSILNGDPFYLQYPFTFNYSYTWNPVFVDLFDDPSSSNDGNLLLLWRSVSSGFSEEYVRWQALSFSSDNGDLIGIYNTPAHITRYNWLLYPPSTQFFLAEFIIHQQNSWISASICSKTCFLYA